TGLTEDSLLLKIDSFGQLNTIFKDTKGQLQKCDYVLITKYRDKRRIIFIELKSSQPGSNSIEIHNQFKSTECLMDYCDSILEKFHNKKNLLNNSDKGNYSPLPKLRYVWFALECLIY
ncbi:MAG: hypothetical protein LWY06_06855, partial [Firmicutes bacterium]|nr:hypothetical protein [Bacillota bacterium]